MKRTIEINDDMTDIVETTIDEIKDHLIEWLDDNANQGEPDTPDYGNDLDYDGRCHEIVDSSVPVNIADIHDIFYLHGSDVEAAFDNAGIGEKTDGYWPCGWRAAAIYCYVEQQVSEWYYANADDVVAAWYSTNRPAAKALAADDAGEFEGMIVNDTSEVPDDYDGEVLHVNDHGNATLYLAEAGEELEELDAIV
jgi:hypothetical protein